MLYILPLLACFFVLSAAQSRGSFISPPASDSSDDDDFSDDPAYSFGSTIDISWTTTLSRVSILLWQNGNSHADTILNNVSNTNKYSWKIDTSLNYHSQTTSNGWVFFLAMYNPGETSESFSSRFFNITDPIATTATTASLRTYTTAPASTGTTSATVSAAVFTPTLAAVSDSTDSSSSSNSVALGVGLGVGLGVPALAGIAALIWFLRRRKQKQADGSVGIVSTGQFGSAPGEVPIGNKSGAGTEYYQPTQSEKAPFLPGNTPAEMMDSSRNHAYEMDGAAPQATTMHELPTAETR